MSDSIMFYLCLLSLVYAALLRLRELNISKINQSFLKSKGYTRKDNFFPYLNMVCLHASFFVFSIVELFQFSLFHNLTFQIVALIIFLISQVLRFSALSSLGAFWNTNIMSAENSNKFVNTGPYRYIRHPNYLAVILEFLFIPLIGGAWRTALIYSIWNGLVLKERIRTEESELFKIEGYREVMGKKRRFLPGII